MVMKVMNMDYTIGELAKLSSVSTRTLRYYDAIGLLKPSHKNPSGYRSYGVKEVDLLQEILFYRELGLSLENIQLLMKNALKDPIEPLRMQLHTLIQKRNQYNQLIETINQTIAYRERKQNMKDEQKFIGLKKSMIDENELKYGKEVRAKYGDKALDASNEKVLNMNQEQYTSLEQLTKDLNETLARAVQTHDPKSQLAMKACSLHQQWIKFYWKEYNPEAHLNLVKMYTEDPRFMEYYNQIAVGSAPFLYQAMQHYLKI